MLFKKHCFIGETGELYLLLQETIVKEGFLLNKELLELYPFSRLSEPANILIMPGLHSANIAAKLLGQVGGGEVIGPILNGFSKSIQIMPIGANVSEILNYAMFAAHDATLLKVKKK